MIENKKYRVGSWPLKKFLEKLDPSYKKFIARKLKEFCTLSPAFGIEPPPIEECFKILGMLEMRLSVIKDIEKLVCDYSGTWMRSIRELTDLKKNCQKQNELIREMIRGYLYKMSKKKEGDEI